MSDKEKVQIGRLALRVDGESWNAYYAMPDTMVDAIPLASIAMRLVQRDDRKSAFIALMRDVVADIIEERVGVRPTWGGERKAPEHERAGRA